MELAFGLRPQATRKRPLAGTMAGTQPMTQPTPTPIQPPGTGQWLQNLLATTPQPAQPSYQPFQYQPTEGVGQYTQPYLQPGQQGEARGAMLQGLLADVQGQGIDVARLQEQALAPLQADLQKRLTDVQSLQSAAGMGRAGQVGMQQSPIWQDYLRQAGAISGDIAMQGAQLGEQQRARALGQLGEFAGMEQQGALGALDRLLRSQELGQTGTLQAGELGLREALGLGQLGTQGYQAQTQRMGELGGLGLSRDEMLNQYAMELGRQGLSQQEINNQMQQFGQQLDFNYRQQELDYMLQTGQLGMQEYMAETGRLGQMADYMLGGYQAETGRLGAMFPYEQLQQQMPLEWTQALGQLGQQQQELGLRELLGQRGLDIQQMGPILSAAMQGWLTPEQFAHEIQMAKLGGSKQGGFNLGFGPVQFGVSGLW